MRSARRSCARLIEHRPTSRHTKGRTGMSTPEAASPDRQRRTAVYVLIAIASLLALLATLSIWANRQALETDTWTDTSAELLEDEDIQTAVSDFMVDALFTNVDVETELQQRLPPR